MSRTLVCAIQIGTSRFCAAAAWRDGSGIYEIAAIETEPSEGCVRRGCVVDIDLAAAKIESLVLKLSNRVKSDDCPGINAAYIGINGISLHSLRHHSKTKLEDGISVNNEITAMLRQQSLQYYIPGFDILGIEPMGYTLDDVDCLNPNGRTGEELIAHHQLVTAHQRLRLAVRAAMTKANINLMPQVFATPLCVAKILMPDEKQRGCVLVDLGHSLTTVSVYADGALQHLATIPLGGNAVTMDLASAKGITLEEAEKLKMSQEKLDIVSRCRYEEIAANVLNQIELSGYKDRIAAGCILTGGGSRQRDIVSLFSERLGIGRIMVRAYGGLIYGISDRKPELAALTTMIPFCTTSCAIEAKPIAPIPSSTTVESGVSQEGDTLSSSPEGETDGEAIRETERDPEDSKSFRHRGSGFTRFFKDLISGIDE